MGNQQQKKVKGVVDIIFLIDATYSMYDCIDALKDNIEMFIDVLTTKNANNQQPVKDWRGAIFGYRDFDVDGDKWLETNDFVRDAADLKNQLRALEADGGGDEPESLLDAIYKVANLGQTDKDAPEEKDKWRYRTTAARVVIIFTDASFKTAMSIPEASGGDVMDIKNQCNKHSIILSIFAPDMPDYKKLGGIDKAEYMRIGSAGSNPQQALKDFTADKKNFEQTLIMLAKTVTKSQPPTPVIS